VRWLFLIARLTSGLTPGISCLPPIDKHKDRVGNKVFDTATGAPDAVNSSQHNFSPGLVDNGVQCFSAPFGGFLVADGSITAVELVIDLGKSRVGWTKCYLPVIWVLSRPIKQNKRQKADRGAVLVANLEEEIPFQVSQALLISCII
jgi:hypothetical protein